MGTFLTILDPLVVLAVVASVSRAVWRGQPERSRSVLLSFVILVVLLVFGLVSISAASGLTSDPLNQLALLVFLVAIAIVALLSWADKSTGQP
jgi:hypothetical protein